MSPEAASTASARWWTVLRAISSFSDMRIGAAPHVNMTLRRFVLKNENKKIRVCLHRNWGFSVLNPIKLESKALNLGNLLY